MWYLKVLLRFGAVKSGRVVAKSGGANLCKGSVWSSSVVFGSGIVL